MRPGGRTQAMTCPLIDPQRWRRDAWRVGKAARRLIVGTVMVTTLAVPSVVAGEGVSPVSPIYGPCASAQRENRFDGLGTTLNNGRVGTAAVITTRGGTFCTPGSKSDKFYTAWVMMAGSSSTSGWTQAGFLASSTLTGGQAVKDVFAQDRRTTSDAPVTYVGGQTFSGDAILYASAADWTVGRARSYVGGVLVLESTWNPYTYWSGSSSQYSSEADDTQTDVPGTVASKTAFTQLAELQGFGSWTHSGINVAFTVNDNPADWKMSPFGNCYDGKRCFSVWHE